MRATQAPKETAIVSIWTKARTGTGPLWRMLRLLARRVNELHIPVSSTVKPVFKLFYALHVCARETVIWTLRFLWYEPLFRSQCFRVGDRLQIEKLPFITGAGRIVIGSGVRLSGKASITFGNRVYDLPALTIGDETFVGHNCSFAIAESIRIGGHCLLAIASGVRMADFDGHPVDSQERREGVSITASSIRPIVIGDDVWIGTGVHILKGVRVGNRAIIGAGSVVTADVSEDAVAAGNPARVVKALLPPSNS
jgi:acetyltransferase-like isoleucine patch superfamily enzyme